MKKLIVLVSLICLISAFAFADEARLLRNPDIHGNKIVFVYAGDLWAMEGDQGTARRLTSHVGTEQFPKFSPDGKHIAFSAQYDGNEDVYILPWEGGEPQRLTYHPGNDRVLQWYPDGKSILFRSTRESEIGRYNRLFKIGIEGGFPEVLPLPAGELTSFNADATKVAYNRKSREFRTWKRYKGGTAQDVWIYDFAANKIERITDWEGTDSFPMWNGDKIYFLSDRSEKMVANIWSYDLASKEFKELTSYKEYDVKWPSLGTDSIVYENAGWLYVLDLKTGTNKKLSVTIYSDNIYTRPEIKNVSGDIFSGNIAHCGCKAVFEARGEIFTVAEDGTTSNITKTPGVRETYPAWSPDGQWIAYFSDASGEFDLYIKAADGKGKEKRVTSDSDCYRANPVWSPDSKKIIFGDARVNLLYADVETGKVTKVDHSKYARATNFITGTWSPDSNWIAYAKPEVNQLYSIFLYSLADGKSYQVTSKMTDDREPAFDPDGNYLYFLANRQMNTRWSSFDVQLITSDPTRIAGVTLREDVPSPFIKVNKVEKKDEKAPFSIDLKNIESRIFDLPVDDGYYVGLKAAKGKVFFVKTTETDTSPDAFPDDPRIGPLQMFDMDSKELSTVMDNIAEYHLSANEKKVLYRSGRSWGIASAAPGQKPGAGRLSFNNMKSLVDYRAEWKQIYNEAWRQERDWFYAPNFHGVDWQAIKARYEVLLPYVTHRADLNYVIGEMVSELCSSHTYVGGGDTPRASRVNVGLLGADYELDKVNNLYKFKKIYQGENWNPGSTAPLSQHGVDVKVGDYLLAVNGIELKYPTNLWSLFQDTAGKEITITVNSKPGMDGAREVIVTPLGGEGRLRYIDWVVGNWNRVQKLSGGKIGYIHLPNTMYDSYASLMRGFYAQVNEMDAIIFDGRFNGGGLIPELFVDKMDRPSLNGWVTRATTGWRTPAFSFQGQMAYLINAFAGSGGDALPYYFKHRGLGPLVGTRTWGGLIGISGNPALMDGGSVTLPDFGVHNEEGEWIIENEGVSPDIEVDDRPDLIIEGHDPTIEKAVEVLLKNIKEKGNGKLKVPTKFPVR